MDRISAFTSLCPSRRGPGGRWTRAAVFTLTSTVLAVVGHHLASEDPVPWPRLLYGAAGVLMASAAAAGTARSWLPVAAATGGAQWVLHTALSVPAPAGHGHIRVLQGAHPLRGQGWAPHHSAPVMMAAHCVAALAVALLMYRADQALSRLPGAVGRWARVVVGLIAAAVLGSRRPAARPDVRSAPRRPYAAAVRSVVEVVLCDVVVRRGPPARRAGDVSLIPVG